MTQELVRRLASEALVVEAAIGIIAAPILGVAWSGRVMAAARGLRVGSSTRRSGRRARLRSAGALRHSGGGDTARWSPPNWPSLAWAHAAMPLASIFVAVTVSMLGMLAAWRNEPDAWPALAAAHATLGAGVVASWAVGSLSASIFRDELDAVAVAAGVVLAAASGFVAFGPALRDASMPLIDAALLASPIVATSGAAGIDLLRTEPFYRLTSIAHRQFEYPAWTTACATYVVVSMCCFGSVAWILRSAGSRQLPSLKGRI